LGGGDYNEADLCLFGTSSWSENVLGRWSVGIGMGIGDWAAFVFQG